MGQKYWVPTRRLIIMAGRRSVEISSLGDFDARIVRTIRRMVIRIREAKHAHKYTCDDIRVRLYPQLPIEVIEEIAFFKIWLALDQQASEPSYMQQIYRIGIERVTQFCEWLEIPVTHELLKDSLDRSNKQWQ